MKAFMKLAAGMVVALAVGVMAQETKTEKSDVNINANVTVGQKPGTTEKITVVQPGPAGETRIMTKETVTEPQVPAARPDVAADITPRKARVVVVPAVYSQDIRSKFERELNEKWGLPDPKTIENPGYTGFLQDGLVNCRKFDVMEREALNAAIKEIDFGESDYADMAKVVKIGNMLNADYVVIPEIRFMNILRDDKPIPYIDQRRERLKGKLSTGVRTVDVKTSKIAASVYSDTWVTNSTRRAAESPASPVRDMIDDLYRQSALDNTAMIVDTAYPMKIVGVGGDTCVINRGTGAVLEGEILDVYETGEIMIDPDTKDNLGYQEGRIGKIKIVKVDPKTATGAILEGQGKIQKLYIVRRPSKTAVAPVEAPPAKLD